MTSMKKQELDTNHVSIQQIDKAIQGPGQY